MPVPICPAPITPMRWISITASVIRVRSTPCPQRAHFSKPSRRDAFALRSDVISDVENMQKSSECKAFTEACRFRCGGVLRYSSAMTWQPELDDILRRQRAAQELGGPEKVA